MASPLSQPVDVFVKDFSRPARPGGRTFPLAKSDRLPDDVALEVTDATARTRGLEVTCKLGQAAALPLPDGSVVCYLSNFGLVIAPDGDVAAAETARVLAAGAVLSSRRGSPATRSPHSRLPQRRWCAPPWKHRRAHRSAGTMRPSTPSSSHDTVCHRRGGHDLVFTVVKVDLAAPTVS